MFPTRFIVLSVVAILLCQASDPAQPADSAVEMVDPLVQLQFDSGKYHLLPAPSEIVEVIAKARNVELGKHWIFASVRDDVVRSDQYLIVAGIMRRSQNRKWEPDPGVLVLKRDNRFLIIGDADGVGLYELNVPEKVMKELMRDYVERLIRAWGSSMRVQEFIAEQWTETGGVARLGRPLVEAMREMGITNVCVYHPSVSGPGYCD